MPKQSQNCSAKQSQIPLTRGENILPINLMPKQSPIYSMYGCVLAETNTHTNTYYYTLTHTSKKHHFNISFSIGQNLTIIMFIKILKTQLAVMFIIIIYCHKLASV